MDLKLLRSFVQLSDTGHYGKAAEKLFVTQSTLSKQMQALEMTVGGPLFERGRHGARLSQLGKLLHQEALILLRLSDDIDVKMQRATAGLTGNLDIGFGISTLITAPQFIAEFRATVTDCQITLNDMPSRDQHQRLLDGRLDIGFCRAPVELGERSFLEIAEEQLALVMPRDMALPDVDQSAALNSLGFVALTPSRGPGLNEQIRKWCIGAQFAPRVVQHADDILTIHAVVAAGLGCAFLPLQGVKALGNRTLQRPLSGEGAKWPIGICWRSKETSPVLLRFVNYVAERTAGFGQRQREPK